MKLSLTANTMMYFDDTCTLFFFWWGKLCMLKAGLIFFPMALEIAYSNFSCKILLFFSTEISLLLICLILSHLCTLLFDCAARDYEIQRDHIKLVEILGEGQFGDVYKGLFFDRVCAHESLFEHIIPIVPDFISILTNPICLCHIFHYSYCSLKNVSYYKCDCLGGQKENYLW